MMPENAQNDLPLLGSERWGILIFSQSHILVNIWADSMYTSTKQLNDICNFIIITVSSGGITSETVKIDEGVIRSSSSRVKGQMHHQKDLGSK